MKLRKNLKDREGDELQVGISLTEIVLQACLLLHLPALSSTFFLRFITPVSNELVYRTRLLLARGK